MPAKAAAAKPAANSPDIYAREASVVERMERIYTYAADGTGRRDVTGVVHILTPSAVKAWSILPVPFAANSEHVEIEYVRVRRPDGTVIPTPASDAQEQPAAVTREAPFYSDQKIEEIPIRSLREGDHLEYKLKILRTKAETPGHLWGQEAFFTLSSQAVILSEVVELHLPKDLYVQTVSPKHAPVIADTATEHVLRWESNQLRPVAGMTKEQLLRNDPDALDIDKFGDRLPDIAWSNFHSWAEVGAWYRKLEGSRTEPDDDVAARVKELTAGKTTAEEKSRAIYGYVGPQVRYIGVAFGIGRFQPHDAGDVLRNQYGDCKDKHTLQAAMLKSAGISSDAVLIGDGMAINVSLPSPGWFNHVITLAHVDGEPTWLDATAEVAPYRLLAPELRGKQALVVPDDGEVSLQITPSVPPSPMTQSFTAEGELNDQGTSHSHMKFELHGDSEVFFRQAVRSVTPAQWDELMQKISESMSYAGKVSNAQFSRADDLNVPFTGTYDYEREKSGDWPNLRILPQLTPVSLGPVDEKNLPIYPIELGAPNVLVDHAVMKIPAGWGVELPSAIHARSDFILYDKTYKFEKGSIVVDRRMEILLKSLPASRWEDYKKWYDDAGLSGENYIQLTRTQGAHAAAAYDDDAAQLVSEANTQIAAHSLELARATLEKAKEANPKQAYLWSNYGYLEMMNHKPKEAIKDYEREIAEHPEEDVPYRLLAYAQRQEKHTDDSIATLHKLLKAHPGDEYGNGLLADTLMERHDAAGAESTLRAGVAANPESDSLKERLGKLQMKNEERTEAAKTFAGLCNASKDPLILNNAAYALAKESLDLPTAEKAAVRAREMQEETINSHSGSDADALRRASLQVSIWDTIGWVYFQEGRVADAEPYLRAAWKNSYSAEVGLHLGVLLEKQKKPSEALETYHLAESGEAGADVREIRIKLADRIEALQKLPGAKPYNGETSLLLPLRTYRFSRTSTTAKIGSTVLLQVSADGKIDQVRAMENAYDTGSALEDALAKIPAIQFNLPVAPESKAPLLRKAVLTCDPEAMCEIALKTPSQAVQEIRR